MIQNRVKSKVKISIFCGLLRIYELYLGSKYCFWFSKCTYVHLLSPEGFFTFLIALAQRAAYVYRRLGGNEMPLCSVFTPLCRALPHYAEPPHFTKIQCMYYLYWYNPIRSPCLSKSWQYSGWQIGLSSWRSGFDSPTKLFLLRTTNLLIRTCN